MARLGAAPHPWRSLQRLLLADPGLAIHLAALGLVAVYVVAIARTPVTPLIDTFLLALVLTLLLDGVEERIARRLIHIEVPEGVTADPTRIDLVFDWRAAELKRAVEIKAGFYRDALPHSHVLSAAKKTRRSAHGKGA